MKEKNTELLAPAGSYESLVAAVNAGADAVYIGGAKFGARAAAESVELEKDIIIDGINYAHHFGVKVYMTVNTLLKEKELYKVYEYLLPYYMAGIDAFIVQDLGMLKLLHNLFPNIDLHASTQMSITGPELLLRLKEYGVGRIVTARELSLSEIKKIKENIDIEIESFVHGALCYAYSGQCLMSSLIGGRSGNRGRCAQTCRLNYNLHENDKKVNKETETNLLSCKDLCSLDILPEIIKAGVYSLKIEGRMKSPVYTAGVISIWRKYLDLYEKEGDKGYKVDKKDRRLLLDLFDRGGQTDGYYKKHNGKDMLAVKGKPEVRIINEEFNSYLEETYVNKKNKIKLYGKAEIKKDKDIVFHIKVLSKNIKNYELSAAGTKAQQAEKREILESEVREKLLKTGNTLYEFEKLDIELEKNLFVPVKMLNELRREALYQLEKKILEPYLRKEEMYLQGLDEKTAKYLPEQKKDGILIYESCCNKELKKEAKGLNVICETKEQLDTLLYLCIKNKASIEKGLYVSEISFEGDTVKACEWETYVKNIKDLGLKANFYMPHIFREEAREFFINNSGYLLNAGFTAIIIRNLEEMGFLNEVFKEADKKPAYIFDYSIYGMNNMAQFFLKELGASRLTLPLELNLTELASINTEDNELIIYGRLPMMVSAQCLRKNTLGCDKKSGIMNLQDRMNKSMPVKNRCTFCYNTILNSLPLSSLGIEKNIKKLNVSVYRIWFTTENVNEVKKIVKDYTDCFLNNIKDIKEYDSFTRGHFNRGIV